MKSVNLRFLDYYLSRKVQRGPLPLDPFTGSSNSFTERELTRKQYLRSLDNRTQEQIAEEDALYLELKRLEQTERQFKKDRDNLLRTLRGIESGLTDIQLDDDSSLHGLSSMPEIKKSKKRTGSSMEIDSPSTPSSSMVQRRIPTIKNPAFGTFVLPPIEAFHSHSCQTHNTA